MLWQLSNKLQEEPNCITRMLKRTTELLSHRSRTEKITKGLYLMNCVLLVHAYRVEVVITATQHSAPLLPRRDSFVLSMPQQTTYR